MFGGIWNAVKSAATDFWKNLADVGQLRDLADAAAFIPVVGVVGKVAATGVEAGATARAVSEISASAGEVGAPFIGKAISGFTKHGIDQVITRGVSPQALLDAARSGATRGPLIDQFGRESLRIAGKAAEFAINLLGQVITAWPK